MREIQVTQSFETAFKGSVPDVPFSDGIDIDALKELNVDPTFVTVVFAKDGTVASDGFVYTKAFNEELIKQIKAEKSEGNMGHEQSMWSDYPLSPAIWVGAMSEDGLHYAKSFIWHEETSRKFRADKAVGRKAETSIVIAFDFGNLQINEESETYQLVDPTDFELRFLDFTPPNRAALQFDERNLVLTKQSNNGINRGFRSMKINDIPEDLKQEIAQSVVATITEQHEKAQNAQQVLFDAKETELAELADKYKEQQVQVKQAKLAQVVDGAVTIKHEKATALKTLIIQSVDANAEDLEKEVETFMQSEIYSTFNEAMIAQLAGGAQGSGSSEDEITERQKSMDAALAAQGVKV